MPSSGVQHYFQFPIALNSSVSAPFNFENARNRSFHPHSIFKTPKIAHFTRFHFSLGLKSLISSISNFRWASNHQLSLNGKAAFSHTDSTDFTDGAARKFPTTFVTGFSLFSFVFFGFPSDRAAVYKSIDRFLAIREGGEGDVLVFVCTAICLSAS